MAADEIVDFYDKHGNVTGFGTRAQADEQNLIYPNVIVFVFTGDGRVWLQKRSLTKKHYAGLWDTSACGGLEHGEDPEAAAERELQEEMDMRCRLHFVEKFLNSFPSEDGSHTRTRMSHIFVGISDDMPKSNHEVEAVAAFEIDELLKEFTVRPDEFVPSIDIEFKKALVGYEKLIA